MPSPGERPANGAAADETLAELEALVEAEFEALLPPPEEPIEALLERLAGRLREHPERGALLERLRALIEGAPSVPAAS